MIQVERVTKFAGPLLAIFLPISPGIGSVISQAIAQLEARTVYFDLYLAELAIPIFVLRVVSQHVIA